MKSHGSIGCIFLCLMVLALRPAAVAQVIQISNVEELYSAVNDPANAGKTLALSPGTYMLSASDPDGVPRPKGGRIEFEPDMSLVGVEGDRSAVVINAFNLPASSFPKTENGVNTGPSASIRMGLGHNALEWLTVRDSQNAQANIDAGLQPLDPGTAYIRVAHVASTGSARGLNVANFGPQSSYQTLEADIIDCYFFDNLLGVSEGVRLGNFQGAIGATVNARMSGNLSWGQQQGRGIENNLTQDATVNVLSSGNLFSGNGAGTIIFGGVSSGDARADGNTINFEGHGDRFTENTAFTTFDQGGLFVIGTENTSSVSGGGSNNTVNISLWGCRMRDNNTSDLSAIGARSVPQTTAFLSQDNHVTVEIKGDGDGNSNGNGNWQPVIFQANSLPDTPNDGNWAVVLD